MNPESQHGTCTGYGVGVGSGYVLSIEIGFLDLKLIHRLEKYDSWGWRLNGSRIRNTVDIRKPTWNQISVFHVGFLTSAFVPLFLWVHPPAKLAVYLATPKCGYITRQAAQKVPASFPYLISDSRTHSDIHSIHQLFLVSLWYCYGKHKLYVTRNFWHLFEQILPMIHDSESLGGIILFLICLVPFFSFIYLFQLYRTTELAKASAVHPWWVFYGASKGAWWKKIKLFEKKICAHNNFTCERNNITCARNTFTCARNKCISLQTYTSVPFAFAYIYM